MMRTPEQERRRRSHEDAERTELERRRDARDEYANRHLLDCRGESRVIRDLHGDAFLAMFSKPAEFACLDCAQDYIPRGIDAGNRYLLHRHFEIADLDENPALELAIVEAKRATPHPLESAARPITPEQRAERAERLQKMAREGATRAESSAHQRSK